MRAGYLELFRWHARGLCCRVERPANMFAYMADADARAVVPEHFLIERDDEIVLFGEAAPNVAPPIDAWFPIGENTGHQFNYER